MDQPLWQPSEERIERANMTAFARQVAAAHGERLRDYAELRAWSVERPELFWPALWQFAEVQRKPAVATTCWSMATGCPAPVGSSARSSISLRTCCATATIAPRSSPGPRIGRRRELSYRELYQEVAKLAAALRREGIGPGDRVAAVMPHAAETIVAMLATTALGAIWSSCSPDFGVQGVVDRFGQIEPKVLITIDGYRYNGKPIDVRAKLAEIVARLPGLQRVVMAPFLEPAPTPGPLGGAVLYDDFVVAGSRADPVRAAAVRPPGLHSLFVGHDRRAQGDRARRRRHPAPAPEGAAAAHRPQAGGSDLLFHHLRLDDVELAGERACDRRDPGGVRRLALPSRWQPPVRSGAGGRRHRFRHQRQVSRCGQEGGGSSRPGHTI